MKLVVLLVFQLVAASDNQTPPDSYHKCLENFLHSKNDSTCDFKWFMEIQKQIQNIYAEIYENFPVNVECISKQTAGEELKLMFMMMHAPKNGSSDANESKLQKAFENLFHIMLDKILMCFDSETFFKKRSTIYDNLDDASMKNCIATIARENSLSRECSEYRSVIYEKFKIDEIFFGSSNVIGVEQLIQDIEKLCSLKGDPEKRYFEILRIVSIDLTELNEELKFDNRERFNVLYIDIIKDIIECLEARMAAIQSKSLFPTSINHKAVMKSSNIILNFFIFSTLFLILILLLFAVSSAGDRRRYQYLRIN